MAMQVAETIDMSETWCSVRGTDAMTGVVSASDHPQLLSLHLLPMIAVMAWKPTVQIELSLRVFRTRNRQQAERSSGRSRCSLFAPVKTWNPTNRDERLAFSTQMGVPTEKDVVQEQHDRRDLIRDPRDDGLVESQQTHTLQSGATHE